MFHIPVTPAESIFSLIKEILQTPVRYYIPIRPDQNDYDKVYFANHHEDFRNKSNISSPGQPMASGVYRGYI